MNAPQAKIRLLLLAALLPALAFSHAGAGAQRARRNTQRSQRGVGVRSTSDVRSWPDRRKRWAIIIGVNEYEDEHLNSLHYAANDATTLYNALIDHAGFPKEQVTLLTSDQSRELQPTRINILMKLAELEGKLPEDALLFFAFSGHSIERTGRAFLFPADGRLSSNLSLLEESTLGVEKLKDHIRATNAGQVVMLLDSCRNSPFATKGDGGGDAMSRNFSQSFNFERRNKGIKAFATFLGTNVGQFAYESSQKKQGFFSWAFVEGLKGKAANERGEVTLAGLKSYVQATVTDLIRKEFHEEVQQPDAYFEGYKSEELVISVVERPSAAAAVQSASKDLAAQNAQGVTDEGFWFAIKDNNQASDYNLYLKLFPKGAFVDVAQNKLDELKKDARVVDAFVAASGKPAETKATPEQSVNSSAPASVLKELYAQSHALVIGVSNYRNGYPNLSGVRDDVPAVTTALLQHGFQVETLLDPTRAEFDTAMRKFISSYGDNPNNRLLVYFAGHGHTLNKGDGVNQGYIVPSDAPLPSHDLAGFKRTAISMDEIEVYALQIEAKHAMFVFDSAFSGAIFDTTRGVSAKGNGYPARAPVSVDAGIRNAIPDIILNDLKYPVRMFFTAGTAEQMVPDESIFRKQFVKGLEGAADINVDGYVTGSELGIFLQDTVAQYSRGRQTPLWGKIRNMRLNRGDFVFASPKTAPSSR